MESKRLTTLAIIFVAAFGVGAALPVQKLHAATFAERLSGRILLQVQEHGEGWYVEPVTKRRYFLGRPNDAFTIMRSKGLGIRHQELQTYLSTRFPARLSGRIMLDVERNGEAYYVRATNLTATYLGRPNDAFATMRAEGLGITNADLAQIPIASDSATPPGWTSAPPSQGDAALRDLERRAFDLVNAHRISIGLDVLVWNDAIANRARIHSADMAAGRVAFGHDGFSARVDTAAADAGLRDRASAENVALNYNSDPADMAVEQWLDSPSHRESMENGAYGYAGMGVARSENGGYYFTQIFIGI